MTKRKHLERHKVGRLGWLRAAVLGANDGLLSTASIIIGVASASNTRASILIAGVAGLIAGAMSMAAGEYVSVSSQYDSEQADLRREADELRQDPKGELAELASIYVKRGLSTVLAAEVSEQLMANDALQAHARDELGLSKSTQANPLQAAFASAISFAIGGRPSSRRSGGRSTEIRNYQHRRNRSFGVGWAGRGRREGRRRSDGRRHPPRNVLGGSGHGCDRCHRPSLWNGGFEP